MNDTIICPNCNSQNPSSQTYCANCGMALAIAAILAESALTKQISKPEQVPLSPEILVPRLGDYLVKKGLIDDAQLQNALRVQKENSEKGKRSMLGQILVSQKLISQAALDTAITEQIFLLQEALRTTNNELEQRVKERTNDLQHALQKITKLNQLKTNFISNISHELRTPLAHMIGYIDLLSDEGLGPLTREQDTAIAVLTKSYNRLYSLIDELIQFSLLSQGEMSINQRSVKVKDLIDNAISHPNVTATDREVTLNIQNKSPEVNVYADQEKICWVIGELLENALKFNKPGGQVVLVAEQTEGMVNFQVADNGIGISEEHFPEIFDAFHQIDGSSTRQYGGTGIGLALAKQILDAHGTNIKVKSVLGKGSSF
ncbi:MAG: ATP-binding protein, partial [Anaerolineales bacterium]